ncbi:hypothetical protein RFI_13712, partial [Reticulomyxa filosa]
YWNTLEDFAIRPMMISRRGEDECILYTQVSYRQRKAAVFENRKVIPTSQFVQEVLDLKQLRQRFPKDSLQICKDLEDILVKSKLFVKSKKELVNAPMLEKDDYINVFAQYCTYAFIFADVSCDKKLQWKVFVDGGHEACYDEIYGYIRSARSYLQNCQKHKFDKIVENKEVSLSSSCYLNYRGVMDLIVSNLWLEFGPDWVDYCFVLICSWEENYCIANLKKSVEQWKNKFLANLGGDVENKILSHQLNTNFCVFFKLTIDCDCHLFTNIDYDHIKNTFWKMIVNTFIKFIIIKIKCYKHTKNLSIYKIKKRDL